MCHWQRMMASKKLDTRSTWQAREDHRREAEPEPSKQMPEMAGQEGECEKGAHKSNPQFIYQQMEILKDKFEDNHDQTEKAGYAEEAKDKERLKLLQPEATGNGAGQELWCET
ncbi:hypothetical protein NDU88_002046 [Pleurodeles waltl]|uniref:Uncharacterized protein n=1 Tax=Pleurodeles waltl TaxID=8319 RepID=A0AAV7MMM5_PLEWA|nr:hypothetical protein NDU88_002046 [Pleurodeles waltl]